MMLGLNFNLPLMLESCQVDCIPSKFVMLPEKKSQSIWSFSFVSLFSLSKNRVLLKQKWGGPQSTQEVYNWEHLVTMRGNILE